MALASSMHARIVLMVLLSAAIGLHTLSTARAQSYPDLLIRLIVPQTAGGPTDLLARATAQRLQSALGQNVVTENRGGAGGVVAAKQVGSADPDGYTLLLGNTSVLVHIPILSRSAGYDPAKVFAPVARLATSYQIIFVNPSLPVKSMQEFVAYAKAHPGKLNYSSAGVGNTLHLAGELLKYKAGIDITHVPYNSGAEAMTAVLGGQVQMSMVSLSGLLPLLQEGKLRAIAATSPTRFPELPDVPTMIESGFPDFTVPAFFGVIAPVATPPAIVDKLNATINQELASPEMQKTIANMGAARGTGSAKDFSEFIAAERRKWQAVVDATGIRID
jgi:tripartite-type tricarboxylate transporter receptor subunit TctC